MGSPYDVPSDRYRLGQVWGVVPKVGTIRCSLNTAYRCFQHSPKPTYLQFRLNDFGARGVHDMCLLLYTREGGMTNGGGGGDVGSVGGSGGGGYRVVLVMVAVVVRPVRPCSQIHLPRLTHSSDHMVHV